MYFLMGKGKLAVGMAFSFKTESPRLILTSRQFHGSTGVEKPCCGKLYGCKPSTFFLKIRTKVMKRRGRMGITLFFREINI